METIILIKSMVIFGYLYACVKHFVFVFYHVFGDFLNFNTVLP